MPIPRTTRELRWVADDLNMQNRRSSMCMGSSAHCLFSFLFLAHRFVFYHGPDGTWSVLTTVPSKYVKAKIDVNRNAMNISLDFDIRCISRQPWWTPYSRNCLSFYFTEMPPSLLTFALWSNWSEFRRLFPFWVYFHFHGCAILFLCPSLSLLLLLM